MKWAFVVAIVLLPFAVTTSSGPASTMSCSAGSVGAVVGGKHVCLRAGQRCKAKYAPQYHRHGFACRNGKLVKRRPPVPMTPVTFALSPVNNSGVTGSVTLTPIDATTTRVEVTVDNPPPGSLPAHVHFGTCATDGGIYDGLDSVVAGKSTTDVGGISTLRRGAFHVNVHLPDFTVIACGDIPRA